MARYLIVENRDVMEYRDGEFALELAEQLRKKGHEATLFLVENATLAARKGSDTASKLSSLAKGGVKVLAEDISLQVRGVTERAEGVLESNMEALAELVLNGSDQVIWY